MAPVPKILPQIYSPLLQTQMAMVCPWFSHFPSQTMNSAMYFEPPDALLCFFAAFLPPCALCILTWCFSLTPQYLSYWGFSGEEITTFVSPTFTLCHLLAPSLQSSENTTRSSPSTYLRKGKKETFPETNGLAKAGHHGWLHEKALIPTAQLAFNTPWSHAGVWWVW